MGSTDVQVRTDLALSCIWYVLNFRTLPDTKSSGNVLRGEACASHTFSARALSPCAESVLTRGEALRRPGSCAV